MVQRCFCVIIILTAFLSTLSHGQSLALSAPVQFQLPDYNPYDVLRVPDFTSDTDLISKKHAQLVQLAEGLGNGQFKASRDHSIQRFNEAFAMLSNPQNKMQIDSALILARAKTGNPFITLGMTSADADNDTINQRFIELSKSINPDKTQDPRSKLLATEALKELTNARSTIVDPKRRADFMAKTQGQYKQILLDNGMAPPSMLAAGWNGLKTMGKPMLMGNIGFTLGAAAQMCGAAELSGDPAMKWACADSLTSLQGWASLFAFSAGAEVSGALNYVDFFKKHPERVGNFGMVVGSQFSHFFDKWANSEGLKKSGMAFNELWHSTVNLKEWGNRAKQMNDIQAEMAKRKVIIDADLKDPSKKDSDELKKAQSDYADLTKQYVGVQTTVQRYRKMWFAGLDEAFYEGWKMKPGEWQEIGSNTIRMLAASEAITIASRLYDGAWAKWALKNFEKVTADLTPEQKTAFEAAQQYAAGQLREFLKFNPAAAKDADAIQAFIESAGKAQGEIQAQLVKSAWKYQIYQKILAAGDDRLPKFLVMAKTPMKRAVKFFVPEVPEQLQLVDGLTRKVGMGEWGYGIAMSAWGAVKFLTVDQILDGLATNSWGAARLQDKLSNKLDPLQKSAADFVRLDDNGIPWEAIQNSLADFNKTWDEFRTTVILRDVNKHFGIWQAHFAKSQIEFYKLRKFLHWMLNASNPKDPDFEKNGSDVGMPWHDDAAYPWAIEKDKQKYWAAYKQATGKNELDPKLVEAYLLVEQSKVTQQDYAEALIMQRVLSPVADQAYFKRQEPSYAKGVTALYKLAKGVMQNVPSVSSVGTPVGAAILPTFDPPLFLQRVGVPFNLMESYVTQLVMTQQICNRVLRNLPLTVFVTQTLSVCSDSYAGLNDIADLAMSDDFKQVASQQLSLIPLDGSPRPKMHTPEERADMIAAQFVAAMGDAITNIMTLPKKYKALVSPIEAPEPPQASDNAQEDCATDLQTKGLDKAVDDFTK